MSKFKEFILKELASDKGLKERFAVVLEKRYGSMARYFHDINEKTQDEIIKCFIPKDTKKIEGDELLFSAYENFMKYSFQNPFPPLLHHEFIELKIVTYW